jgi:ketosteroid isomerase-like protein
VATDPARAFIDRINARDADGLAALMTDDHELIVFDESPLRGRDANVDAWRGYFRSFPQYVIWPHEAVERDGVVAVLGHTTGSHVGLSDDQERKLTLIWLAEVVDRRLRSWRLVEDTPARRQALGLRPILPGDDS